MKESIEKRMKAEEMGEYIKEVLVPVEKVVDVRNGKKTVTSRKLHPGYVYIDMVLLDDSKRVLEKPWYFIQETPGKIGFVGGDRPVPVTPRDLAIVHVVWRHRYLATPQLLELWWPDRAAWAGQRRLLKLHRAGYLDRFRPRARRGSFAWPSHRPGGSAPASHRAVVDGGRATSPRRSTTTAMSSTTYSSTGG